jgi:dTDP-glucose 4,6-dehydratase
MTGPLDPGPWFREDADPLLARVGPSWERLAGRRVLLTGGTGFLGRWVLASLLHARRSLSLGGEVMVLTRDPDAFARSAPWLASDPAVRLVAGDVRRPLPDLGPLGVVIHGAADVARPAEPGVTFEVGVQGTRHVLDAAARGGATDLLLLSSGAVYGRQPPTLEAVPETWVGGIDPLDPRSAYALGKLAAEWMAVEHGRRHGTAVRVARCFAFVGPMMPMDGPLAIGNFIRDAVQGRPIRITGDGTPLRTYLHAADLAGWLWRILLEGAPGRAYNVGGRDAVSIAEVARRVDEALGTRVGVECLTAPKPGAAPERYVPDVSRAEAELGLAAWTDLPTSIRRTAAWYRQASGAAAPPGPETAP